VSIEDLRPERDRKPSILWAWLALLRPKQWAKNVFVLAPALFSASSLSRDGMARAIIATATFCLLSSAVYALNDVIDADADRNHPRKRRRPVAAGQISPAAAIIASAMLATSAIAIAYATLPRQFLPFAALYVVISLSYCQWLKTRVIVDVLAIAMGFASRLLAGSAAIDVEASSWMLVCGFSLALVLGFGKRRTEVQQMAGRSDVRNVLAIYTPQKLDMLLAITCAISLVAYMSFTVAPETIARHGSKNLIYTVPLVAYGLFRYLFKVQEGKGDDPTEILLGDPVFALTGVLWAVAVVVLLYVLK